MNTIAELGSKTAGGILARSLNPELMPDFLKALRNRTPNGSENRIQAIELLKSLLEDSARLGASDIHVEPHREGTRLRVRLDGAVRDVAHLTTEEGKILVNQFKALANLDPIVRFTPRDAHARYLSSSGNIDLRLALAPTLDRETLSVRLLDPRRLHRSVAELGLSETNLKRVSEWLDDISGMFIATGPTGSGKTTTLYALLHALKDVNRVIISLEDPVEYQINGISQIQIDELHNFQFSDGIKSILRHDPDYLMVGEIRDSKSAHTAVSAAVAGRVLLSTLHSRDCVGAVSALRNWGLENYEIAQSLAVVVSQRLIRKSCSHCAERRSLSPLESLWFESVEVDPPAHVWEGAGCGACHHMGYKGRTGVFELWRLDESDYEMILRRADEHALRAHLAGKGHSSLFDEAFNLLQQGITTVSELRRACGGMFANISEIEQSHAA